MTQFFVSLRESLRLYPYPHYTVQKGREYTKYALRYNVLHNFLLLNIIFFFRLYYIHLHLDLVAV